MSTLSPKLLAWVQHALPIDDSIQAVNQLKGSTSTTLYKIKTNLDAYVLRLYDNKNWLEDEPDLAIHEKESLTRASTNNESSLKVPKVIKVDETGEVCGMPAILMSFVPGRVDLEPANLDQWLKELARGLADIHKIEPNDFKWKFFRYNNADTLAVPGWTKHPDLWRIGMARIKEKPPAYKENFIHRDYHPVNVLWEGDKLVSVVDWVNACRGPAAIDVGHCRNNLVCLYGVDAADTFLKYYQFFAGNRFTYDIYWDLICYFDFVYPGPPEVYQGWVDFGLTHLSSELLTERLGHYLTTLID
jgi:aminoglycoside phosphotransferase (APT) family kinase protein